MYHTYVTRPRPSGTAFNATVALLMALLMSQMCSPAIAPCMCICATAELVSACVYNILVHI